MAEPEFIALLQSRLKQVDDLTELDEAAKTKIREQYQKALGEMEAAKRWTSLTAENEKLAADAPKDLVATKAALRRSVIPAYRHNSPWR